MKIRNLLPNLVDISLLTSQSVATIKYKFSVSSVVQTGGSTKSIAGELIDCREGSKMISYEEE